MQSGNSAATSSGPSGAASAVAPRKSIEDVGGREREIKVSATLKDLIQEL